MTTVKEFLEALGTNDPLVKEACEIFLSTEYTDPERQIADIERLTTNAKGDSLVYIGSFIETIKARTK